MNFSIRTPSQSPFSSGSSTPKRSSSGTTTPTITTQESRERSDSFSTPLSKSSSHDSLGEFDIISLEKESERMKPLLPKEKGIADFTAARQGKDFFEESVGEDKDFLSSKEVTREIDREKIRDSAVRGEVISLSDFKTLCNYSKKDLRDPSLNKLLLLLKEYDEKKNQKAPEAQFDLLESLAKTTQEYLKSFAEKPDNSWDNNKLEAAKLLHQSIDAYFIKINEDLTRATASEHEELSELKEFTDVTDAPSLENNDTLMSVLTKEILPPSDTNFPLSEEALSLKAEARETLVHFLAQRELHFPLEKVKETLPKLIDEHDALAISKLTTEEFNTILDHSASSTEERASAQQRLRFLKNHLQGLDQIKKIQETSTAQQFHLDVTSQEGFEVFLNKASYEELQVANGYTPMQQFKGAALITDWNQKAEELLASVSIN